MRSSATTAFGANARSCILIVLWDSLNSYVLAGRKIDFGQVGRSSSLSVEGTRLYKVVRGLSGATRSLVFVVRSYASSNFLTLAGITRKNFDRVVLRLTRFFGCLCDLFTFFWWTGIVVSIWLVLRACFFLSP